MLSNLQSLHLAMNGVGTGGETALKPGVHLRWSFQTQIVFPTYVLALYRKPTLNSGAIKIPFGEFGPREYVCELRVSAGFARLTL